MYTYGRFPDSIYGNGCGAKTEESTPYGSKKHRVYTEKNIPPCVRIAYGYCLGHAYPWRAYCV